MFSLVREVGAWNSGHFALRSLQTVVNSDSCSILGFIQLDYAHLFGKLCLSVPYILQKLFTNTECSP